MFQLKIWSTIFWIEGFFKKFVTDNYYGWLFFVAGISCVCIFRNLYKYSIDFPMTMYLFIAGGTFTWLINGIRQFFSSKYIICI